MTGNPSNAGYITELLQADRTPLLPFEGQVLVDRFKMLGSEQEEMGTLLHEAMVQGAENWDDNAPVDVINRDALVRVAEAARIIATLDHAVIVGYPLQADHATLGSLIGVRFGRASGVVPVLFTGVTREVPSHIVSILPEDPEIATLASPLGKALLGGIVNAELSYNANGRTLSAQIATIEVPKFPEVSSVDFSLGDNQPRVMKRPPPSWQ